MLTLVIIVIAIMFLYSMSGKKEEWGSDWFHRGKLAEIGQAIQKQVQKSKMYQEEGKEGYDNMEMTDEPLEKYNPNRNVISKYSFKADKNEKIDPTTVQVGQLEVPKFAMPEDYIGGKPLADYLEVDKYSTGSGSISELKEAYKMLNKDQYFQTLKALRARGGNVYFYPKKPCDVNSKEVSGFL
jgi:hypothetical protein